MRVKIVTTNELPGGFVIEAETPEDVLILRMFCAEKRDIYIANFGGNINEGKMTMLVQHRSGLTKRAADLGEKAHLGDPCIYCGKDCDKVGVGDCPNR